MDQTPRTSRRAVRAAASLVAGLLVVAGCGQPIGTYERPLHIAEAARASYDLPFIPGTALFRFGEVRQLQRFLRSLALGGNDDIVVFVPRTGREALDARRIDAAYGAVVAQPARIRIVVTPDAEAADRAQVAVTRTAQPRVRCPELARDDIELEFATPIPPIGCANAANLAHMAASVRDLTRPRALGPSDATTSAAAVRRYREGNVAFTPLGSSINR